MPQCGIYLLTGFEICDNEFDANIGQCFLLHLAILFYSFFLILPISSYFCVAMRKLFTILG